MEELGIDFESNFSKKEGRIEELVSILYPKERTKVLSSLKEVLRSYSEYLPPNHMSRCVVTPKTVILITYGDSIQSKSKCPLKALSSFASKYLSSTFSCIHLLPFFPSTSDRGFSVINYREVDPKMGSWEDIENLKEEGFQLMFDFVLNHCSSESEWFKEMLLGNPKYTNYFNIYQNEEAISQGDLELIRRPRCSPLLTKYRREKDTIYVWTTFSPDQIDINWGSGEVFIEMLSILLFYIKHGMSLVRLDAITYTWKIIGTECASLPNTHLLVQLLHTVISTVSGETGIITETNVPHLENISYLGSNEADMVYNFALPPLLLNAYIEGDSTTICTWLKSLESMEKNHLLFNYLDSHDGIGLPGCRGILSEGQIAQLIAHCQSNGGRISYKNLGDGTNLPYELNITWWSAIFGVNGHGHGDGHGHGHGDGDGDETLSIARYLSTRYIALSLKGVPGIYIHGLLGSPNDYEDLDLEKGGENRNINRKNLDLDQLLEVLEDTTSLTYRIYARISTLLHIRAEHPAFDPYAPIQLLHSPPQLLTFWRINEELGDRVLVVVNITACDVPYHIPFGEGEKSYLELISGNTFLLSTIILPPYSTYWMTPTT